MNKLNRDIIEIIRQIRDLYGISVFRNATRLNNLLADLAPDYPKERIQIRNLIELGAFAELEAADADFDLVRRKLVRRYIDTYFVEQAIAEWTVGVLSAALAHGDIAAPGESPAAAAKPAAIAPAAAPRVRVHRHLESTAAEWVYTVKLKNGYFYIIGRKKDGTVLKSMVEPGMLLRLSRLKVLLLHQRRVVQIVAGYTC